MGAVVPLRPNQSAACGFQCITPSVLSPCSWCRGEGKCLERKRLAAVADQTKRKASEAKYLK